MDRERCLEFLVVYGVWTRMERLPHNYWEGLTMVARVGHYYGKPFKRYRGVT